MKKLFGKISKQLACMAMGAVITLSAGMLAGCFPDSSVDQGNTVTQSKWLRDIYSDHFSIGAAVLTNNIDRYTDAGLMGHFNSITGENEMKWRFLEPNKEGVYAYEAADSLMTWAQEHDAKVRGHCLVWYKSLPAWLSNKEMTGEEALMQIREHITETMTHFAQFGDTIYAWDVVNEALHNDVTQAQLDRGDIWRTGRAATGDNMVDWYALTGTEFIKEAFRTADEMRKELDLDVKLYYNDYSLNNPIKREAAVKLVEMLREEGIAIDGIGMQAHYRLPGYEANPEGFMKNFEDSVRRFTELGLDVQITELDLCVYPTNDTPQAFDALPLDVEISQAQMFADIFEVCRKYSTPQREGSGTVTNVTTWGVADDHTWGTNTTHREFPLMFSRELTEKRAYYEIISF